MLACELSTATGLGGGGGIDGPPMAGLGGWGGAAMGMPRRGVVGGMGGRKGGTAGRGGGAGLGGPRQHRRGSARVEERGVGGRRGLLLVVVGVVGCRGGAGGRRVLDVGEGRGKAEGG